MESIQRKRSMTPVAWFDSKCFADPPTDTYPVYAWVWNAPISEDGIRTQLDDFCRAGIRGIYVLAEPKNFRPEKQRTALEPEYFSDEYVRLLTFAYRYAAEKEMALWLYDEGGWPSGGACGRVLQKYPDAAAKVIANRKKFVAAGETYGLPPETLGAFAAGQRVRADFTADEDTVVTEYFVYTYTPNDNFVNLIDEKAVNTFLDLNFAVYAQLGALLGDTVRLSFTDEPRLMMPAWTAGLAERFAQRYGYDLCDHLPEICSGAQDSRAVRDYSAFCRDEFRRVFFAPYAARCRAHGILFGGHLDREHTLAGAAECGYADKLPVLREMDVPGIDVIWRQIFPGQSVEPEEMGIDFYPRLASSAANQRGSGLALSESFSVYGDGLSANAARYVIHYQLVRGINVFNLMSLPYGRARGLALCMRPALCPEKPGFFNLRDFQTACARESYLARIGVRMCDTALYYPAEAVVAGHADAVYAEFVRLGAQMERACIDFDLIDADAIRNGVETDAGLKIGTAVYRHIVVPANAEMPGDAAEIAARYPGMGAPLIHCTDSRLRAMARRSDSEQIYMIFNESADEVSDTVQIRNTGFCCEADVRNGLLYERDPRALRIRLAPGAAVFLICTARALDTDSADWPQVTLSAPVFVAARRFEITVDGVSSRAATEGELSEDDFSGEATYAFDFAVDRTLRGKKFALLTLNLPGCTVRAAANGECIATCAEWPQQLFLPADRLIGAEKIRLTVANNAVNEIVSKTDSVFKLWDDVDYNLYHPKTSVFERESQWKFPNIRKQFRG